MYISESTEINLQRSRKRGRPALDPSGNRTDRRQDIIRASSQLFFYKGYVETTLRRVATDAQVNVALIHYYFTNKQGLYQEVLTDALQQTLAPLRQYQQKLPTLYHLIHVLTEPLILSPALARVVLYPNGDHDGAEITTKITRRIRTQVLAILLTMQRTGRLRKDLDADLCTSTFLDLCWGPIRQTLELTGEAQPFNTASVKRQIAQNTRMLEAAILPA